MFQPYAAVDGQEPFEGEPARGQAGHGQSGNQRTASGNGHHRHVVLGAQTHNVFPRVTDGGCSGVGHQSAAFAGQKPLQNLLACGNVVVLMIAEQGLFECEVVHQLQGYAGVFGRDKICLL